jgi:hypothetical protein
MKAIIQTRLYKTFAGEESILLNPGRALRGYWSRLTAQRYCVSKKEPEWVSREVIRRGKEFLAQQDGRSRPFEVSR